MTPITITDPALVEQLRRVEATELRDPDGRVLGRFTASEGVRSGRPAYTRDDVRRFREQLEEARRRSEAGGVPPADSGRLPAGLEVPTPDESRRESRRPTDGKPLLEALRDLENRL